MTFSITPEIIDRLLSETLPSYQATSLADQNLGFGFLFYSFVRVLRPKTVVVIGSKAGFSVIAFALGLKDNNGTGIERVNCYDTEVRHDPEGGSVYFVDPGFSEAAGDPNHWHGIGFWRDPAAVEARWRKFGVGDIIRHYQLTSRDFLRHPDCPRDVDILYIDGDHSYEGVRHDFLEYRPILRCDAIVLAHDVDPRLQEDDPRVGGYAALRSLSPEQFEVFRLPVYPGLAILRRR
jgi:predicted O-methyltransferase YrrM